METTDFKRGLSMFYIKSMTREIPIHRPAVENCLFMSPFKLCDLCLNHVGTVFKFEQADFDQMWWLAAATNEIQRPED